VKSCSRTPGGRGFRARQGHVMYRRGCGVVRWLASRVAFRKLRGSDDQMENIDFLISWRDFFKQMESTSCIRYSALPHVMLCHPSRPSAKFPGGKVRETFKSSPIFRRRFSPFTAHGLHHRLSRPMRLCRVHKVCHCARVSGFKTTSRKQTIFIPTAHHGDLPTFHWMINNLIHFMQEDLTRESGLPDRSLGPLATF
jgi:hypothetical protein